MGIHTNTAVSGFTGTGTVTKVQCGTAGEFDADLVIVGIGILPNVALAEEAGFKTPINSALATLVREAESKEASSAG